MCQLLLIKHGKGAVGFRCFGLGPHFRPVKGIHKLQQLFDANASWASRRGMKDLKKMISKSTVVVTAWNENKLIGFGRATSDTIFRAVLWEIDKDGAGTFDDSAPIYAPSKMMNNRLVGRSVWNTKWKLIIPGKTLLNDPNEGLERFINNVSDIKIHFETYSYSGN